jgi:hypothetical protein
MSKFLPGVSGNPKGRPPRARTLSDLLAAMGEMSPGEGQPTYQAQLANNLWQLLSTGRVELENGPITFTNAKDWLEAAKFLIHHIDGPAPTQIIDSRLEIIVSRVQPLAFEWTEPEPPLRDDEA